jgi:cytochrome c2
MRKTTWIAVVAGTFLMAAFAGGAAAADAGQDAFMAAKCNMCHAVQSAGIEAKVKSEKMVGPDLGGYAPTMETDKLLAYLAQAEEVNGAKHKKKWEGSADEAKVILAWLKGLEAAK